MSCLVHFPKHMDVAHSTDVHTNSVLKLLRTDEPFSAFSQAHGRSTFD